MNHMIRPQFAIALSFAVVAAVFIAQPAAAADAKSCEGVGRNETGSSVATMALINGNPGKMALLLSRPIYSVPGRNAAAGADVSVGLELQYSMDETPMFDGVGVEITFLSNAVKGPIDLTLVIGGAAATRQNLTPSPDGHYRARLGAGPAKGNAMTDALDSASEVQLKASIGGSPDQGLFNAVIPVGTPAERDALGGLALDQLNAKAKAGC